MHRAAVLAFGLSLVLAPGAASAGPYSDELGKCLIGVAGEEDKVDLVVWMFGAVSMHPAVRAHSSMTPAARDQSNHRTAQLLGRLLTRDCRAQAVAALRHEGEESISTAFGVLGEVAMGSLIEHPEVTEGLGQFDKHIDHAALDALGAEAAGD